MIHLMTSISHLLYSRGREQPAGEEGQAVSLAPAGREAEGEEARQRASGQGAEDAE